jgi:hypothetical protein
MVTNASSAEMVIESLEIINPQHSNDQIHLLSKNDIEANLRLPGSKEPTNVLGPAQSGYIRVNLTFTEDDKIPLSLEHIITLTTKNPYGPILSRTVEDVCRTQVDIQPAPVIGPPLKGDRWIAIAVGGDGYHRTTIMPLNGSWLGPERWAVDWIKVDDNNRLVTGDITKNESYPQYGQEVIAVADGIVISARDGMPDLLPGKMPENMTIQNAGGNQVVQNIGDGYSAFYAHLIPGSLRVREGEYLRKGQIIGLLGNSGNTDAPHLHFQVNKGTQPLGSDSSPYVIDSFELMGRIDSDDNLESEVKKANEPVMIRPVKMAGRCDRKMPANLSFVNFGEVEPDSPSN